MSAQVCMNDVDVSLRIDGEDQSTWSRNSAVVHEIRRGPFNTSIYISQSVVQQMLRDAYAAGFRKGGKQLAQVKALLKD